MQIDLLGQRTVALTDDEATALSAEVDALGAVGAIRGSAPDGQTLVVNDENVAVIVRALDHVRNSHGSYGATDEARDSLLRYAALSPLAYRLRSWEFQDGEERTFWSYTGAYEANDRIVEGQSKVYDVVRVERQATPLEHGVLLVQSSRSS